MSSARFLRSRSVWRFPRIYVKREVLILCLVILTTAGIIFYWYRVARRVPRSPVQVPSLKWTTSASDSPSFGSSLIVDGDGALYAASVDGRLFSLDPSSALRWEFRAKLHNSITGGLLQDEARNIYFTTLAGEYSLSPSGLKRWETPCSSTKMAQDDQGATFDDAALYTTCGENFTALNKNDGSELWSLPALDPESAPVMLENGVLLFKRDRRIFASDRNGKTLWSYPRVSSSSLDPRVFSASPPETYFDTPIAVGPDETIYLGSRFRKFVALDSRGVVKWTFDGGDQAGFRTSPVVASDGTVIAVSIQGVVFAFAADGSVIWRCRIANAINSAGHPAPILGSDGAIYVFAEKTLTALSAEGNLIWQFTIPGTPIGSPALASDGTLYIATSEGLISAVQTESHGLMKSAWPKYQHDSSNSGRVMGTEVESSGRASEVRK
jgi:outer membrane protein assembly factor BamB